jgi:hypothetical protein
MRESPDAVIRWAEAVADDAEGSYKRTAFQKAANVLAAAAPVRASTWVEKHIDRDYADGAASLVARRWSELDPAAALDWVASLPPGDRERTLRATLVSWLNQAPDDAEAWLRESSPAAHMDGPVEFMISRNSEDLPVAISWAERIDDEATRGQAIVRLGRTWMRREPEAAKLWLEQSDLHPNMKSAVMKAQAPAHRRVRGAGPVEAGSSD